MLRLKNARYLSPAGYFVPGELVLDGPLIQSTRGPGPRADTAIDLDGCLVIPGLIDLHTHGALGIDTMEATPAQFVEWSAFLARNGVTSFLPTTVTAGKKQIARAMKAIRAAAADPALGASIEGAHIEGPYISCLHKGCHDPSLIVKPSSEDVLEYRELLGKELVLRVTVAPELEGGMDFIRTLLEHGCFVTLGHSDATYAVAHEAVLAGANSFTHLFNGMRALHHREPGIVGEALTDDAYVELICDGIHLHPAAVDLAVKSKGLAHILAVTDSIRATGKSDGTYLFGGMTIHVSNGVARIPEGNLAGSTLLLKNGVENLAAFAGLPFEQAVQAATINPARAVGLEGKLGAIEPGKRADLIVLDERHAIRYTICRGKIVYDATGNFQ